MGKGWKLHPNRFYLYDLPSVILDLLFFYFVGRLYQPHSPGIDVLFPWGIFIFLGSIYHSVASNYFEFLKHSLSMYEIMCDWPVILFIYAFALLAIALVLVVAHIRSHWHRGVLISRLMEGAALFCIFMLPYFSNDNFHLHHWYGMWWLGMQSNAPEWWSRSFMAYCLGSYINGIAVWGRDPILGCNYAFYLSTNMECSFMACYEKMASNETELYKPFVAPNWRTCNADAPPWVTLLKRIRTYEFILKKDCLPDVKTSRYSFTEMGT